MKGMLTDLMLKSNYGVILVSIVLLVSFLLLITGCQEEPMESYVKQIEDEEIIIKIDELEDEAQAIYSEFDRVSRIEIDESEIGDFRELKKTIDALIEKQTKLLTTVQNLGITDEEVVEVNNHLIESLNKNIEADNYFYVIAETMIELKMIDEDPPDEGLEEELNRIIITVFEADEKFRQYKSESEVALGDWKSSLSEVQD